MKNMKPIKVDLEKVTNSKLCEMFKLPYIPALKNTLNYFMEISDMTKTNKEVADELDSTANSVKTMRSRLKVAGLLGYNIRHGHPYISDEDFLNTLNSPMKLYGEFVEQSGLTDTHCLKRIRKLVKEKKVGLVNFQVGRTNPAVSKYKLFGNASEVYIYKMTHVQKLEMANIIVNITSSALSSYLEIDVRKDPKNLIPMNMKKSLTHYLKKIVDDKDVRDMVRDWYAKPWS
jgi:hypothetical protein